MLANQLPVRIHELPSGTHCGPWLIPEAWACKESTLETISGEKIFSYAEDRFCVRAFSQPFEGEVSREELLRHLSADPASAMYLQRDWGLRCNPRIRSSLRDPEYSVKIRTEFYYGNLRLAEASLKGSGEGTILLLGDLAPHSPAGAVVGAEVFRRLSQRKNLCHSYQFVLGPAALAAAWLLTAPSGAHFVAGLALGRPLSDVDENDHPSTFRLQDLKIAIPFLSLSPLELEANSSDDEEARLEEACVRIVKLIDEWETARP